MIVFFLIIIFLTVDCGTGTDGKRKDCKNCTCGLADELDAEAAGKKPDTQNATSSCGNVRLYIHCFLCNYEIF